MMKFYSGIFALIILMVISSVSVQAQQMLTIDEAIEIGLENNYGIQLSKNFAEIADNNRTLGNAGFLPVISLSTSHTERVEDSEFEAGGEARSTTGARSSQTNAAVNLDWTLFDGLQMFSTYDRLGVLRDVTNQELRFDMEALVAQISLAYYNIVRINEQLKILANNIEVSEERIEIEETKLDLGSGSRYDLLQARSDLNADRAAYIRETNQLTEAKIVLNELLSRDPEEMFDVTSEININRGLVRDDLYQRLVNENTELTISRLQKDISRLEIREIRAERYPEISLNTGYSFNRSENDGGFIRFNETTGFSIGLTARVNLFDGFNQNRRVQNAQINQKNAEITYEMQKLRLESDFAAIYRSYENALELVDLERDNFENAQETLDIALERFRLGTISSLEFREAQRTFLQAENRLINVLFDAKVAETNLLQLSGDLGALFTQ
ncbi:MAG: TolC family protein [Balneolaceae bacterium]|nr:TolC family protein [Balneolaceae bacterium]